MSAEDAKERKIMKLLLKVKNGTPPQRKSALRYVDCAGLSTIRRCAGRVCTNKQARTGLLGVDIGL